MWSFAACTVPLIAIGTIFYGPRAILLAAVAATFALMTESACSWLARRCSATSLPHSLAMGLMVALMLPATAPWYVAAAGAVLAVAGGKWLMGGLGHYPWNPAVVALLLLFLLWPQFVTPQRWPLLDTRHVLSGNGLSLAPLAATESVVDWQTAEPPAGDIGFSSPRADTTLHQVTATDVKPVTLDTAIRDRLPSWPDMLIGAVAGPLGQGSTLALILTGLVLIWRGYLPWTLPLAVLAGAFATAAILPAGSAGWLPIHYSADGMPLGLIWVGYHVLLPPTLFVAVLLAGETVTSPLTRRSQLVYGLGVGFLTVALRWSPVAVLSGCWAVLAMNTLVPLIDSVDRRCRLLTSR